MPLPPSGPISMSMINVELALPATQVISLNDANVRALAQVPAGMISLSNFYGKSAQINKGYLLQGTPPAAPTTPTNTVQQFDFPTNTGSTLGTTFPTPFPSGFNRSNWSSPTNGYVTNVGPTPTQALSRRLNFAAQTYSNATISSPHTAMGIRGSGGNSNTAAYTYTTLPQPTPTTPLQRAFGKMVFSTETITYFAFGGTPTTSPGNANNMNLTMFIPAFTNFGRGYVGNGSFPGPLNPLPNQTIMRLTFATDTSAYAPNANLQTAPASYVFSRDNGFIFSASLPACDRYSFSTETRAVQPFPAASPTSFASGAGISDPVNRGVLITASGTIFSYPFATTTLSNLGTAGMSARTAANINQSIPMF